MFGSVPKLSRGLNIWNGQMAIISVMRGLPGSAKTKTHNCSRASPDMLQGNDRHLQGGHNLFNQRCWEDSFLVLMSGECGESSYCARHRAGSVQWAGPSRIALYLYENSYIFT